jgi:hypothetical protein
LGRRSNSWWWVGELEKMSEVVLYFIMFLDVTLVVVNNRKYCGRVARELGSSFSHHSFLATMNAGVQNLVISLGAMQRMFFFPFLFIQPLKEKFPVARKIPFDDPEVLTYVRIGYVLTQLTALAIYYYVSLTVCFSVASSFPN